MSSELSESLGGFTCAKVSANKTQVVVVNDIVTIVQRASAKVYRLMHLAELTKSNPKQTCTL